MFNETTSYFSDATNPGGTPLWQQLNYESKAAWKQAGRPGSNFTPPPGLPKLPAGGSGGSSEGGTTDAASGGGIGDLLGGIPPMYLMIGAAIVLLMVLKK